VKPIWPRLSKRHGEKLVIAARLLQDLVMSSRRRRFERTKPCACTGVRWCAACRKPEIRAAHGMDDPLDLPAFLRVPPEAGGSDTDAGSDDPAARVFGFDPGTQCAPGCPDFEGAHLLLDFVSQAEARRLLRAIESAPFVPSQSGKQKQHYGAKINFNKRKVNVAALEGLPSYAAWLESRLRRRLARSAGTKSQPGGSKLERALAAFRTSDVFVLRYRSRDQSNLDLHVDDPFAYGEVILDLSLESDARMTFVRERTGDGQESRWDCVRVPIPARSMLVLFGSARFAWQHGILAYDVSGQRTSITLRCLGRGLRDSEAGRQVAQRAQRRLRGESIRFEVGANAHEVHDKG
jgi:alkylated DNA repair protein alkB family protein 4